MPTPGAPAVHRFAWDTFLAATDEAKAAGLYGAGQDLLVDAPSANIRGAGPAVAEIQIDRDPAGKERPAEPFRESGKPLGVDLRHNGREHRRCVARTGADLQGPVAWPRSCRLDHRRTMYGCEMVWSSSIGRGSSP